MKGAWRIRIKVGDEMVPKNNLEILLKLFKRLFQGENRERVPNTGETIKIEMPRRISGGVSVIIAKVWNLQKIL